MQNIRFKWLGILLTILFFNARLIAQDTDSKAYKSLIVKNATHLGITTADASDAVITNAYTDANTKVTYVYLQQSYKQIKVYNTIITAAFRQGSYLYSSGQFVKNIATKAGSEIPVQSYANAVRSAAQHLELNGLSEVNIIADNFNTDKKFIVSSGNIAKQNIDVTLYWTPSDDKQQVTLTWNVNIDVKGSADWWNVRVNAQTGAFVQKDNWTVSEHFSGNNDKLTKQEKVPAPFSGNLKNKTNNKPTGNSSQLILQSPPPNVTTATYRVIPYPVESPNHGAFVNAVNPWLLSGVGNNATTIGWHFDSAANYTTTRGNNVFAYLDRGITNGPNATTNWPDTSTTTAPSLSFVHNFVATQQPTVTENQKAAIDNLFYWNNLMHDVFYQYGFTELSGNFQQNNMNRGGIGGDYVRAEAQDGGGTNNANFSISADGGIGRMQMYLWSPATSFVVNTPVSIAGRYEAVESGFSTNNKLANVGPISGQVIFYNDNPAGTAHEACGAAGVPANIITGKVALIYRGTCGFAEKVKNAQNAGAIAVIMVNNVAGAPIVMGGTDNTITIPAIMISQADGTILTNKLSENVTVTMSGGVNLDGDLDNGIVCHEYGHGISSRLTGGPANASCLSNAEQGGEGWSDYFALMMTTNWNTATITDGPKLRPVGTYAFGQLITGAGIRRYPYTTNLAANPLSYADMATSTEVHNIGEIWCAALWDMTWNIIQQQGSINANLFNANSNGGNSVALNLVMTGLKLQPCNPGFLDARNAILAADSILYGSAHYCAIWSAFARRGMGYSAVQGLSTVATDQTAAFDSPAGLIFARPTPVIVSAGTQTTISHVAKSGCQPVTGYILRDTIPTGFTYVSSTPSGTLNGNVLTFPSATFAALETRTFSITLQNPATGCTIDSVVNDNREASAAGGLTSSGTQGWVPSTAQSHTPTSSWYAAEPATPSSSFLTSAATTLSSTRNLSILSFWHYFNTEKSYDGGVIEYSTNGGTTWNDAEPLFLLNGYNGIMDNSTAIGGRKAYTGTNNSFQQTFLNLTSLGTSSVLFRFESESDDGTGGQGWFVDDIARANGCGGILKSGVYNASGTRLDTLMQPVFVTPPVLPLTLLWFYANQVGNQVTLDWKTVSEVNVKDFIIEWSTDGISWTSLGNTTAQNRNANSYSFLHSKPVNGNNYYRIKMNDVDGHFTYSPVRLISFKDKNKPMVVLIPNPVSADAMLYISKDVKAQSVKVYDAAGSLVRQFTVGAGVQQIKISTSNLASGVYNVETSGDTKIVTRMLVQH